MTTPGSGSVLWKIGDDSLSPFQFSAGLVFGDEDPAPFEIGRSDSSVDWPRVHPGPLDAAAGFRPRSMTVRFIIPPDAVDGQLAVVADLYASHGPCPQLRLDVNGRTGRFVLDPVRMGRDDAFTRTSPVAGVVHLVALLPAGAVLAGVNELVITTIAGEQPDEAELTAQRLPHLGTFFGSALTWRRLTLIRLPLSEPAGPLASAGPLGRLAPSSWSASAEPDIRLVPTPFYVDGPDGLRELVDLRVRTVGAVPTNTAAGAAAVPVGTDGRAEIVATVTIGDDAPIAVELDLGGHDFGDATARFAVLARDGDEPVPASVVVRLDGAELRTVTEFRPARRWTLHLMPHVHLDLGYTDSQGKVFELHNRNLDRALDLIERDDGFRFTVDGTVTVENYLATRAPSRVDEALRRFADGHLELNAYAMLFLSGFAGLEELYRAAYTAIGLGDEHGLPVTHAHLTDVPSYSWSVPSTLRALGVEGFVGISNHTRGGSAASDELHLRSPLRWAGPDGAEVLAFFADCYSQLRFLCADPPTVAGMADGFTRLCARYERDDYLPADLPVVGTHADNEDLADGYADVVTRWNARYAYPRLRLSTFAEYLDAVRPLADRLPAITGDGGSYWEDHAGTQAGPIARLRSAQSRLAAADALHALLAFHYDGAAADRATLDRGWQHLVVGCEHTWTAGHATMRPRSPAVAEQLAWKTHQIESAWRIGADEGDRALSQLAELLALRHPQLLVVNPTARERTIDVVRDLPAGATVTDHDGVELAVEPLAEPADGYAPTRIRVPAVPAFGYRVLRVASPASRLTITTPAPVSSRSGGAPLPELAAPATPAVAPARYDVTVDAGGRVTGLRHRVSGRELVDPASSYSLAEVLYVSGGGDAEGRGLTDPTSLFDNNPYLPQPELTVHRASMRLVGQGAVPGGHVVRLAGSAPSLPDIRVELRLHDDSDTVDVTVRLRKEPELAKESVYVAFPFLASGGPVADGPTVRYDRQIGWVDPSRDHLPGACNEWFAVQQGVAVTGQEGTVVLATVDVPLVTLDVVRGTWATQCRPVNGTVLSWAMNNYWWTNTAPSQQGTVELRYALRPSGAWDEAAASRFVRDVRAPALVNELIPQDRTMPGSPLLPPGAGRLLDIDVPETVDVALHAGGAPRSMVVRLQDVGRATAVARLRHPGGASGTATRCDAAERPVEPLEVGADGWVEVPLTPYAVVTLVLAADLARSATPSIGHFGRTNNA